MSEDLMGTRQAGQIAGKHQRTIVDWIRKGYLPAKKLPGRRGPYLILESDLRATMKQLYTPQPYEPGGGQG